MVISDCTVTYPSGRVDPDRYSAGSIDPTACPSRRCNHAYRRARLPSGSRFYSLDQTESAGKGLGSKKRPSVADLYCLNHVANPMLMLGGAAKWHSHGPSY